MSLLTMAERLTLSLPDPLPRGEATLSSVLALIGWNGTSQQEEILLTKRTDLVETHKGQVSFPGGFWEEGDSDLLATALREAHEEIALQAAHVKILGSLEPVRTKGNVLIYPWVGRVDYPYPFQPNPGEVATLLYLPVERLLKQGLAPTMVAVTPELTVETEGITIDNELVWGATARILSQLREHLLKTYR